MNHGISAELPELAAKAPETVDRIKEATHFLQEMLVYYHDPEIFRYTWVPGGVEGMIRRSQVLLESDFDPSLPKKWGWINEDSNDAS